MGSPWEPATGATSDPGPNAPDLPPQSTNPQAVVEQWERARQRQETDRKAGFVTKGWALLGPPGRQVSPVRLSLPHFRLRPPLGDGGRTERVWAHTAGLPTLLGHLSHLSWLTTKASTHAAVDLSNASTPTSPSQPPCRWPGRHFVQMPGREVWGWGIPAMSGQADKRPHLSVPGGAPGQRPVPGPPLPLPLRPFEGSMDDDGGD